MSTRVIPSALGMDLIDRPFLVTNRRRVPQRREVRSDPQVQRNYDPWPLLAAVSQWRPAT